MANQISNLMWNDSFFCEEIPIVLKNCSEKLVELANECFKMIRAVFSDSLNWCYELVDRIKQIRLFQKEDSDETSLYSKRYLKRVATNLEVLERTINSHNGKIHLADKSFDIEDSPLERQGASSAINGYSVVDFFRSLRAGTQEKKPEENSEKEGVYVNPYYFSDKQEVIENALIDAMIKGDMEKMHNHAPKLTCGVFRSVLMTDAISAGIPEYAVVLINTGPLGSQSEDYGVADAISSGFLIVVEALNAQGYITDKIANKYLHLSLKTLNIFEFLLEHRSIEYSVIQNCFTKATEENRSEICKALLKRYIFDKTWLISMKDLAHRNGNADLVRLIEFYC